MSWVNGNRVRGYDVKNGKRKKNVHGVVDSRFVENDISVIRTIDYVRIAG